MAKNSPSQPNPRRSRLPNRRPALTQDLRVGEHRFTASVGFDEHDRPKEIFLDGAKDGTDLAAILDDASVVLSVALQFGIPATALARSVARLPAVPPAPPYLDQPGDSREKRPATVIGAVLDLVQELGPSAEMMGD